MEKAVKETKDKMESAIQHLKQELLSIRTGRANPAMLDKVQVEVYGASMRLKDISSISVPEPKQLVVAPFDASNVHAIAKGVEKANLGIQPQVDGPLVRIKVPEMDASVREEMRKLAKAKGEEAKIRVRNARRDGNDAVKKQKAAGEIPEDRQKRLEKEIQDLTDKFCKEADTLTSEKEKEIVTV